MFEFAFDIGSWELGEGFSRVDAEGELLVVAGVVIEDGVPGLVTPAAEVLRCILL